MIIKLLCINTSDMCDYYGNKILTIKEGDIVNAFVDRYGVHFEYETNCYTEPYSYEVAEKNFISAFDKESYDKIYKEINDCRIFLDGVEIGRADNVKMKVSYI